LFDRWEGAGGLGTKEMCARVRDKFEVQNDFTEDNGLGEDITQHKH